eukprot:8546071-Lingulodinium_polyedra.AAC.1
MSSARKYYEPVAKHVLDQVHHYSAVSAADHPPAPGDKTRVPPAAYTPSAQTASVVCKGLVSTSRECKWPSFSPQSHLVLYSEMALLRVLAETGLWERASSAWFTSLLPVGMLVRNKAAGQ